MLIWLMYVLLETLVRFRLSDANLVCGNVTCSMATHGCTSDGNSCRCMFGYEGPSCDEDRDECSISHHPLCGTTGICNNVDGGFQCDCLQGWYGSHCRSRNTSILHSCLPGWTGEDCQTDIDECMTYVFGLVPIWCGPYGTCLNTDGSYTCKCMPGWTGDVCFTDINECDILQPCPINSTCYNNLGSFLCICDPGLTGENCTTDVDECLYTSCGFNKTCSNTFGSYACIDIKSNSSPLLVESSTKATSTGDRLVITTTEVTTTSDIATEKTSTETGLIVGVTVGGFLVIVCVILGVFLQQYISRKSRKITSQVESGN